MKTERRVCVVAAVAGSGALLTHLTREPQFVLATAGACGWLLVGQTRAVRSVDRVDRSITVTQTLTPGVAVRDGLVRWRVAATLNTPRLVGSRVGRGRQPVECRAAGAHRDLLRDPDISGRVSAPS